MSNSGIDKSGSWYSYQGERIGQGRESVRTFLKDNPKITETIAQDIRKQLIPSQEEKTQEK